MADDVLFQPVHQCSDSYYTGMQTASLSVDAAVHIRTAAGHAAGQRPLHETLGRQHGGRGGSPACRPVMPGC
ncbi:MAG: hypothetical protein MZV70_55905 [Desulfobacterales bacterium]|nr:hypothetical protein [Desulfobacterales bacterium]